MRHPGTDYYRVSSYYSLVLVLVVVGPGEGKITQRRGWSGWRCQSKVGILGDPALWVSKVERWVQE